jgi:dienelactone hydrolase
MKWIENNLLIKSNARLLQRIEFIMTIQRLVLSGIPCLFSKPENCEPKATVFFYHGWSSYKEYMQFTVSILSLNGYAVILPDLIHHGERGKLESYTPDKLMTYFWKIIFQTVDEAAGLLQAAVKTCGLEEQRLVVAGESMGGFSAAGMFAQIEAFKCLVNFNGSCAWEKAEQLFRPAFGRPPASDEELVEIRRYDPFPKLKACKPRPILLLHGDADTTISVENPHYFYQEMMPSYAMANQNLTLIESPNLDHYITVDMLENCLKWLDNIFA